MSACLLSLSVISLVLPVRGGQLPIRAQTSLTKRMQTAFHASFADSALADEKSLIISRGTSIVWFPWNRSFLLVNIVIF